MKLYFKFIITDTTLECDLPQKDPTLFDLKLALAKAIAKKHFANEDPFYFLSEDVKDKALLNSTLLINMLDSKIKMFFAGETLSAKSNNSLLRDLKPRISEGTTINVMIYQKLAPAEPPSLFQQSFKTLLSKPQGVTTSAQKLLKNEKIDPAVNGAIGLLNELEYKLF